MKGLSRRQRDVLDFIRSQIDTVGRPPTLHEIKNHFGWTSVNAAHCHVQTLQAKGELQFDKHQARAIRLKDHAPKRQVRELPLVGRVAAGNPIEAIEHADDSIGVDPEQFPEDGLFALKVVGDSMTDAGIFDGDTVIVRQQEDAPHGSIVVATIDGEATVKRLIRKGKKVVLHPENDAYADIPLRPGQDVAVCGVVVGVTRRLS